MKHLSTLFFTLLLTMIFNGVNAKEKVEKPTKELSEEKIFNRSFNRWSLELNGGFNSLIPAGNTIVNSGVNGKYSTSRVSPFHIDLGARFMVNRFVGIKTNIGYDQVSPGFGVGKRDLSKVTDFKGHYYGIDIEGVVNIGQLLKFPEFTRRFGLLAHSGIGYRNFKLDKSKINLSIPENKYATRIKRDNIIDFKWGITPMFRIIDRLILTADFSQVLIFKQQTQLNGSRGNRGPVDAILHTYSLGLTVNLGKNKQHIDWAKKENLSKKALEDFKNEYYRDRDSLKNEIQDIRNNIDELATKINHAATNEDLDKLRNELNNAINDKLNNLSTQDKNDAVVDLSSKGLLATYFDFDVRTPQITSSESIKQVAEYLKANPNANLIVTGFADATGTKSYNNKLAQDRANNVKNILVNKYGINASRINAVSGGIDNSADKNLARKATYFISK